MNAQTLKFINDADRQYLASLNRRVRAGEIHLIEKANEQLTLTGQSTRLLNKLQG